MPKRLQPAWVVVCVTVLVSGCAHERSLQTGRSVVSTRTPSSRKTGSVFVARETAGGQYRVMEVLDVIQLVEALPETEGSRPGYDSRSITYGNRTGYLHALNHRAQLRGACNLL